MASLKLLSSPDTTFLVKLFESTIIMYKNTAHQLHQKEIKHVKILTADHNHK